MRHETIANGWYSFALRGGEFGVLVPGGVQTHLGFIAASQGGRPLFIHGTAVGGFQFAGQGEGLHGTLVWNNGWTVDARIPTVNGVIYDHAGKLHIWQGGPHQSSQGYRYVRPNGSLVMADDTYSGYGLSQYIDVSPNQDGSRVIGQGHHGGGVQIFDGTRHFWIATGACHNIRCDFSGDNLALSFYEDLHGGGTVAHLIWATWQELLAEAVPVEPHVPDPPPPDPEPSPMSTPNESARVRTIFQQHPPAANSTESCARLTRRVAYALNPEGHPGSWGLLTKSPGEAQHEGYAVDAIIYGQTQQVVDIIQGAEGPNPQPGWLEVDKRPNNNWAKPLPVEGTPPPPPPPPDDLKARVEALEKRLLSIEQKPTPSVSLTGKRIALKADHGKYVAFEPSGMQSAAGKS
jgi:hypothetical protein